MFLIKHLLALYFAFGANMNDAYLQELFHLPPQQDLGCVVLDDYAFGYTLDLIPFNETGTAANIIPCTGSKVYGVLYELTEVQLQTLDLAEDVPEAYSRVEVEVHQGEDAYKAWVYLANPKYLIEGVDPDPEYVDMIVEGAIKHHLPQDYIDQQLQAAAFHPLEVSLN